MPVLFPDHPENAPKARFCHQYFRRCHLRRGAEHDSRRIAHTPMPHALPSASTIVLLALGGVSRFDFHHELEGIDPTENGLHGGQTLAICSLHLK